MRSVTQIPWVMQRLKPCSLAAQSGSPAEPAQATLLGSATSLVDVLEQRRIAAESKDKSGIDGGECAFFDTARHVDRIVVAAECSKHASQVALKRHAPSRLLHNAGPTDLERISSTQRLVPFATTPLHEGKDRALGCRGPAG